MRKNTDREENQGEERSGVAEVNASSGSTKLCLWEKQSSGQQHMLDPESPRGLVGPPWTEWQGLILGAS